MLFSSITAQVHRIGCRMSTLFLLICVLKIGKVLIINNSLKTLHSYVKSLLYIHVGGGVNFNPLCIVKYHMVTLAFIIHFAVEPVKCSLIISKLYKVAVWNAFLRYDTIKHISLILVIVTASCNC